MRWLVLTLPLMACNAPGTEFRGIEATRIEVAGSVFDVRLRGELAEAIRVNPQYAPRFGPIRARAGVAIAAVSGCEVREVLGDQAVALGRLRCDDEAPAGPRPVPPRYSCLDIDQWIEAVDGLEYVEFECDPL